MRLLLHAVAAVTHEWNGGAADSQKGSEIQQLKWECAISRIAAPHLQKMLEWQVKLSVMAEKTLELGVPAAGVGIGYYGIVFLGQLGSCPGDGACGSGVWRENWPRLCSNMQSQRW